MLLELCWISKFRINHFWPRWLENKHISTANNCIDLPQLIASCREITHFSQPSARSWNCSVWIKMVELNFFVLLRWGLFQKFNFSSLSFILKPKFMCIRIISSAGTTNWLRQSLTHLTQTFNSYDMRLIRLFRNIIWTTIAGACSEVETAGTAEGLSTVPLWNCSSWWFTIKMMVYHQDGLPSRWAKRTIKNMAAPKSRLLKSLTNQANHIAKLEKFYR